MKNTIKSIVAICMMACVMPIAALAQQALGGGSKIVSPEIHENHTVTFRLRAPKAVKVQVTGDCIPKGVADLVENKEGVWEYTTPEPLKPELYGYTFRVDGLKINDPSNVYMIRDVNTITNVFIIGGERADLYKVNDVPHGTVSKVWYDSPSLGMVRRLTIYTPAGYETSGKRYPVFYLLHGSGGDEEAWMDLGRTSQILDNLIAQGKAEPMIVVMPYANAMPALMKKNPGMRMDMRNLMGTDQFTNEIVKEIIPYMEKNYRVKTDSANRALAGLSMGGGGPFVYAQRHPDMFNAAYSTSGLLDHRYRPKKVHSYENIGWYWSVAATSPVEYVRNATAEQIEKLRTVRWMLDCGDDDGIIFTNLDFFVEMHREKIPVEFRVRNGKHNWAFWREALPLILNFSFK